MNHRLCDLFINMGQSRGIAPLRHIFRITFFISQNKNTEKQDSGFIRELFNDKLLIGALACGRHIRLSNFKHIKC